MRGEVFIAPAAPVPADGSMINPATARFWASWQDEAEPQALEDVELDGAEAAIEWAAPAPRSSGSVSGIVATPTFQRGLRTPRTTRGRFQFGHLRAAAGRMVGTTYRSDVAGDRARRGGSSF